MTTETGYGWVDAESPRSMGIITPRVFESLTALRPKRILDIGAGNGALTRLLKASGFAVVGIEPDDAGRRLAIAADATIPIHGFAVGDDPAALLRIEEPFDVVVSTEVIEHLYHPRELLEYAAAVLVPGGSVVLTTPYHGWLKNCAIALSNKWDDHHHPLRDGGHIKFWSRTTISELLTECGFRVTAFTGAGRLPYLWESMVVTAKKD